MDPALIALLGGCLSLAILLYYVIFIRRDGAVGSWGKSGLLTLLFVLIPVLVIALWNQSGAESRLALIGLSPYPGLTSSSGVATGQGKNPVWVFSVEGGAEPALKFYSHPENHKGWTLVSKSKSLLLFKSEGKTLVISANAESMAFMLTQDK